MTLSSLRAEWALGESGAPTNITTQAGGRTFRIWCEEVLMRVTARRGGGVCGELQTAFTAQRLSPAPCFPSSRACMSGDLREALKRELQEKFPFLGAFSCVGGQKDVRVVVLKVGFSLTIYPCPFRAAEELITVGAQGVLWALGLGEYFPWCILQTKPEDAAKGMVDACGLERSNPLFF